MEMKSNMTEVITSLVSRINSVAQGGANHSKIARIASESILSEVVERIHTKGLASDNTAIGKYSTKPIYVSVKNNIGVAIKAVGKAGVTYDLKSKKRSTSSGAKTDVYDIFTKKKISVAVKANSRERTSAYFFGGYNEFKTSIGRNQLGSVNLSLSGQMQNQLAVLPTNVGWGIGFQNAELLKLSEIFETEKYKKQIWALTADEKNMLKEVITFEVKNAILRTNSN